MCFGESTSIGTENELKSTKLRGMMTKKVAIVKSRMIKSLEVAVVTAVFGSRQPRIRLISRI
jgi:hypothetical protein